jgi:hypothetical protein
MIRWDPNPKATSQETEISKALVIVRTDALAEALEQGTKWAEVHLPREVT